LIYGPTSVNLITFGLVGLKAQKNIHELSSFYLMHISKKYINYPWFTHTHTYTIVPSIPCVYPALLGI